MTLSLRVDGRDVAVEDEGGSLLDALREELGLRGPKDGCSPQGQCGCCTVWVDGAPRVSCVTPVRRVAGREVTTADGLPEAVALGWAEAMSEAGGSQCGFCTPGIVMRLAALAGRQRGATRPVDEAAVRSALGAHLCRCTGWQTIVEAAAAVLGIAVGPAGGVSAAAQSPLDHPPPAKSPLDHPPPAKSPLDHPPPAKGPPDHPPPAKGPPGRRDPLLAAWRAQIEGPAFQTATTATALGRAGFADDRAPAGSLVALPAAGGGYATAPTLTEARRSSGKVQGRNSTVRLTVPLEVPEGSWALSLRTTWVEPAYLEPDASWCLPGGVPASPLANGGAFGGKRRSPAPDVARRLAAEHGRAVRVVWSREEVVRRGPKRPPVAIGLRADGTGILRVARTPGSGGLDAYRLAVAAAAPGLVVEEVAVAGPPVSHELRGAGWAEAAVVRAVLGALGDGRAAPGDPVEVVGRSGGRARVSVEPGGPVTVDVWAGEVLDPVVLRSYCIGAVHQALGWVRSEGIAVGPDGEVQDLTIRSYGILSARETPWMDVTVHGGDRWPVNGSDAVLAATAAAAWITEGLAPAWPTRRLPEPATAGAAQ